ncbi:MAG: biopolymer transporter ExbD [Candidatus Krumholzibacteria bacterium]|nr:biopolymer transporter ExbD [Candidatus Krumholzibacteria bacterium]
MKFKTRHGVQSNIPTASMADIIFLLLIFFMVTTIFKLEEGLPITLPRAESGAEQERERLIHVWADRYNRISINDRLVRVNNIHAIIAAKFEENRGLIVAFNVDHKTKYRLVSRIMEELKDANAVNVSFTSMYEESP